MSTVNVNLDKMEKMASFVTSAAPKLEKLAAQEQALATAAPAWVDGLIAQGLLKKEARDAAINDLLEGGIEKISEVIEYLIGNVGPQSIGQPNEEKRASATPVKGRRQSDVAFESAILG